MTSEVLTGQNLYTADGIFRIGNQLQISSDSAVYQTEYGDSGQPVLIELMRADQPGGEEILTTWREALALSHPHLIRVYAAGTSELEGMPVIYRVMESADESLAGVLAERVLSEGETREMLEPALSALGYLHQSGYVHGDVAPAGILAVGDTLKLSASRVARAGSGGKQPPDDMKALGAVLAQALTGHRPGDVPQIAAEPWRGLLQHLLDPDSERRWTAEQATVHLKSPQEAVPEKAAAIREKPKRDQRKKWILGAIAALLILVGTTLTSKREPATSASLPAVPVVREPAPIPQPAAKTNPPAPPVKKAVARTGDHRAAGWAVIVAAYGTRQPAEKRSRELATKWPAFTFGVFEPPSEKARYLIVIGSNLSEDHADALQRRAIASGVAPDAYIKRFMQQ